MNKKNVLLIGSGGREHALGYRLRESPATGTIFCVPGNPGLAAMPNTICLSIDLRDHSALRNLVVREEIRLAVIGPEGPLRDGLADVLSEVTPVFGCSREAAILEASKVFAKAFMGRHQIPTAAHEVFSNLKAVENFLAQGPQGARGKKARWVVKADGLSAGKGVTVCDTPEEVKHAAAALFAAAEGQDTLVVLEERLVGREVSVLALCDGETLMILPPCEDHKRLLDGDRGPMTGGMGAICPTPVLPPHDPGLQIIYDRILLPTARGMIAEGRPFHGLLYAGLMLTKAGPMVLEFNCRFGDPETQALMMVMPGDLLQLLSVVAERRLLSLRYGSGLWLKPADGAAVCVVMATTGYPTHPRTGDGISGIPQAAAMPGVQVFEAGTQRLSGASNLITAGGRVLSVTARERDLAAARSLCYRAVAQIQFPGATYRRDIGARSM